jgi:hypothetical protein
MIGVAFGALIAVVFGSAYHWYSNYQYRHRHPQVNPYQQVASTTDTPDLTEPLDYSETSSTDPDDPEGVAATLPLSKRVTLFFEPMYEAFDCGSAGCTYRVSVGLDLAHAILAKGFDSYSLDCDTGVVSFEQGDPGRIFGFVNPDPVNKIVAVYTDMGAMKYSENIYHIATDGSPTLIASYDEICSTQPRTLYLNRSYPTALTKFST